MRTLLFIGLAMGTGLVPVAGLVAFAFIDMARIELTFGTDPQLRRLAQEIVTDQESEIQLMKLWRQQHTCDSKPAQKSCTDERKEW